MKCRRTYVLNNPARQLKNILLTSDERMSNIFNKCTYMILNLRIWYKIPFNLWAVRDLKILFFAVFLMFFCSQFKVLFFFLIKFFYISQKNPSFRLSKITNWTIIYLCTSMCRSSGIYWWTLSSFSFVIKFLKYIILSRFGGAWYIQ